MTTDIYLDPLTDDIDLTQNVMRLTNTIEELSRQKVTIALKTFKGEWFANVNFGIPYLANDDNPIQLLGAGNNQSLIDAAVRDIILTRDGIVRIVSFSSSVDRATRSYTATFQATTEDGEIITETITT